MEPLTEDDFDFDKDYDDNLIPHQQDFHISYVLEMTKLAIIRTYYSLSIKDAFPPGTNDLLAVFFSWRRTHSRV